MTAEGISLLIGAVAGLIAAITGLVTAWQRKAALDADALEKERNALRRKDEKQALHIHDLRLLLAEHGIEAPDMHDDETKEPR